MVAILEGWENHPVANLFGNRSSLIDSSVDTSIHAGKSRRLRICDSSGTRHIHHQDICFLDRNKVSARLSKETKEERVVDHLPGHSSESDRKEIRL